MSELGNKIPFALKEGRPVSVEEVERGLASGCVCMGCGRDLVARKGDIKQHHFAHTGEGCGISLAQLAKVMAKEIIVEEKKFYFRNCEENHEVNGGKHSLILESFSDEPVDLDEVAQQDSSMKYPYSTDLVFSYSGEDFYVDVITDKPAIKEKIDFFKNKNWNFIQINLKGFRWEDTSNHPKEELKKYLFSTNYSHDWLSLVDYEIKKVKGKRKLLKSLQAFRQLKKKVSVSKNEVRVQESLENQERVSFTPGQWFICLECRRHSRYPIHHHVSDDMPETKALVNGCCPICNSLVVE